MSLQVGDVIRLRNFVHHFDNGETRGRVGYKAGKKHQFVAVLLGVEPRDGSAPIRPEEVLQSLGWTPPPEEDAGDETEWESCE